MARRTTKTAKTLPTLPTQNEEWGFFGTIRHHADSNAAWPVAMAQVAQATGADQDEVRAFLDSRYGRHFADDCANGLVDGLALDAAIAAAVARWMGWRIGRRTSRETGIPVGLPYLTGFVHHEAIAAEAA